MKVYLFTEESEKDSFGIALEELLCEEISRQRNMRKTIFKGVSPTYPQSRSRRLFSRRKKVQVGDELRFHGVARNNGIYQAMVEQKLSRHRIGRRRRRTHGRFRLLRVLSTKIFNKLSADWTAGCSVRRDICRRCGGRC